MASYSQAVQRVDMSGVNSPNELQKDTYTSPLAMAKTPDFIIASDINTKDGWTICQAICKQVGSATVDMVQLVKNLWRIYLLTKESKIDLVSKGVSIEGKWCNVYNSNPYATGLLRTQNASSSHSSSNSDQSSREEMLRVTIKDLH